MKVRNIVYIVVASIIFAGCQSNKKVTEVLYDQYNGTDGFSILVLPPNFVDNFISEDKEDEKELLKTIKDFRLMFFDREVDGKSQSDVQDEIFALLDKRGFEDFIDITKDGARISVKGKSKDDVVSELHVLIGGEKKLIMASLTGNIDFQQVTRTIENIDLDDFEDIENFTGNFDFDDLKFIF